MPSPISSILLLFIQAISGEKSEIQSNENIEQWKSQEIISNKCNQNACIVDYETKQYRISYFEMITDCQMQVATKFEIKLM